MIENADVFDFELSDDDMEKIKEAGYEYSRENNRFW